MTIAKEQGIYNKICSAKSYVRNGLVAMWDGIENFAYGVNDPSSSVWSDLIGGVGDMHFFIGGDNSKQFSTIPMENDGSGYFSDCVRFCAAEDVNGVLKEKNNKEYTFEVVKIYPICPGVSRHNIVSYIPTENICDYGWDFNHAELYRYVTIGHNLTKAGPNATSFPSLVSLSICSQPKIGWFYCNGELQNSVESDSYDYYYHSRGDCFGNGKMSLKLFANWVGEPTVSPYRLKISSVRIYDRILSAEEVNHNYEIDVQRFGV